MPPTGQERDDSAASPAVDAGQNTSPESVELEKAESVSTPVYEADPAAEEEPVEAAAVRLTTTPVATTTPEAITFSPRAANSDVPADIIKEVFYVGGGGSGWCAGATESLCLAAGGMGESMELNNTALLVAGQWQEASTDVELIYPDGRSVMLAGELRDASEAVPGADGQILAVSFHSSLDDPPGTYTFTFPYYGALAQRSFEVREPDGPRLYVYGSGSRNKGSHERLELYNFEPGEEVRIFAYQAASDGGTETELVGWETFTVDENGGLSIALNAGTRYDYVAVGERAGQASGYLSGWSLSAITISPVTKNGVLLYDIRFLGTTPVTARTEWEVDEMKSLNNRQFASCQQIEAELGCIQQSGGFDLYHVNGSVVMELEDYLLLPATAEHSAWLFKSDDLERTCPGLASPASAPCQVETATTPEETLKNYYEHLNRQQYEEAWGLLSAGFRQSFHNDQMSNYISGYREMEVCEIVVEAAEVLSRDENRATVRAPLTYYQGAGCAATPVDITFTFVREGPVHKKCPTFGKKFPHSQLL